LEGGGIIEKQGLWLQDIKRLQGRIDKECDTNCWSGMKEWWDHIQGTLMSE
jgi:hypothetical protein